MKIENSQMLQTQMDMGSSFKLDNQGNIKTQGKIGEFFQAIGDKFRSAETINARNENLMVAMGTMLKGGDAAAPLNGPQNLAAPPAMDAEGRATALQSAQKAIMQGAISRHIEATYGDQTKGVQDAILRQISTLASTSNARNLTELKSAMNREIARSEQNSAQYANTLSKCTNVLATSSEKLAPQRAAIGNNIKQNMTTDIRRNTEFPNNIYNSYTKDSNRRQPIFNGVKTTHENFNATLREFSQNPVEERMLGYLCSQTTSSSFLGSALGVMGPPLSEAHANPAPPLLFGISNKDNFSVTREDNGDVLINKTMTTNVRGTFENVPHNLDDLGTLEYSIRVPHEQFANFANASDELARLGTQEEKDAYMTGLLQDFEPQLEISHMTLTPPTE